MSKNPNGPAARRISSALFESRVVAFGVRSVPATFERVNEEAENDTSEYIPGIEIYTKRIWKMEEQGTRGAVCIFLACEDVVRS